MKQTIVALVVAAQLGFAPAAMAAGEDIAVIVNKSNPIKTLTMFQLRKIVMAQEDKWPSGGRISVWMVPPGQPERVGTLRVVCGMSETDFTLYFLHGAMNRDAPKTMATGAQVQQSIALEANGVGFMLASQLDGSAKVVTIDGYRPGEAAYRLKASK